MLDAYRQPYIPFYLLTKEFFRSARAHLNPGGVFVINVGHLPDSDALEKVVSATLRAVFPDVIRDPVSATNTEVLASDQPLSGSAAGRGRCRRASRSDRWRRRCPHAWRPALSGGSVYTDDRAPVEWLTDLSILRYATGAR